MFVSFLKLDIFEDISKGIKGKTKRTEESQVCNVLPTMETYKIRKQRFRSKL